MTIEWIIGGYAGSIPVVAVILSYLSGRYEWDLGDSVVGMSIFWPVVLSVYILMKTVIFPLCDLCELANKRGKESKLPPTNEHPTAKKLDS